MSRTRRCLFALAALLVAVLALAASAGAESADSLSPARAGVPVSLEFVPTHPFSLPAPIVDSVITDAAGNFSEDFDREQGGVDYGAVPIP